MHPLTSLNAFLEEHKEKETRHSERIRSITEQIEMKENELRRLNVQKRLEERVWVEEKKTYDTIMNEMRKKISSSSTTPPPPSIRHPSTSSTATIRSQTSSAAAIRPSTSSTAAIRPAISPAVGSQVKKRRRIQENGTDGSVSDVEPEDEEMSAAAKKKRENIELYKRSGRPMLTDTNIIDYLKQLNWSRQETQDNTGLGKDLVLQIRRGDVKDIFDSTRQVLTGAINWHRMVKPPPSPSPTIRRRDSIIVLDSDED